MKQLSIIIVFFLLISNAQGQNRHRILIVSRDSNGFFRGEDTLRNAISHWYSDNIETHIGLLPDSLGKYDAIFTDLRFFDQDDTLLIADELKKLSQHLVSVGNLYVEVTVGITYKYGIAGHHAYDEYPQFKELTGVSDFGVGSSEIHGIKTIQGVSGYFTEGINIIRNTNPSEFNSSYMFFIHGDLSVILQGDGRSLAWQHQKNNQKVVFHWPIVSEHYNEFIGRLVCNFFALCTPLIAEQPNIPQKKSRIIYDFLNHKVIYTCVEGEDIRHVFIYSILGSKVSEITIDIGSGEVAIPKSIPSGSYIVVLADAEEHQLLAQPIVIY